MKRFGPLVFGAIGLLVLASCGGGGGDGLPADIASLPPDTGGRLDSHSVGAGSGAEYNHYAYLPSGAVAGQGRYPALVYLHGDGATDDQPLVTVSYQGPIHSIAYEHWRPPIPMIVLAPQNHGPQNSNWSVPAVQRFVRWALRNYPIDSGRIYLSGASRGGFATYSYLSTTRDTGLVAAAVPVMGGGSTSSAKYISVPVWAFHGDSDKTVSPTADIALVDSIRSRHPGLDARITIFRKVGHETNGWLWVFRRPDSVEVDGRYAPYDRDIYSWMVRYRR